MPFKCVDRQSHSCSRPLCVAAGRALLDQSASAVRLAKIALVLSASVQVFAALTPHFPTNRMPGDTPLYVGATVAYYGGWLLYLFRSRRVAAMLR
jgi:hypothetical protein